MILHVVLKSKDELSTLKSMIPGALIVTEYEDSYLYVKLQYSNSKFTMAYVVTRAIPEFLVSIEELQQWVLLVSLGCNFEEALTQITGGT